MEFTASRGGILFHLAKRTCYGELARFIVLPPPSRLRYAKEPNSLDESPRWVEIVFRRIGFAFYPTVILVARLRTPTLMPQGGRGICSQSSMFFYRVMLILLAFTSLHALPAGVYLHFLPHFEQNIVALQFVIQWVLHYEAPTG